MVLGSENRRRRWHRQRLLLITICVVCSLSAGAYFFTASHSRLVRPAKQGTALRQASDGSQVPPVSQRRSARPVYPYSVVRGGAYTPAELMHAVGSDPVAASHYAGFDYRRLHMEASRFTGRVYVSYRIGNAVYWTSHPVWLQRNEPLITDGTLYARARCGNRIALQPQRPVALIEPLSSTLETPQPDIVLPPSTESSLVAARVAPVEPYDALRVKETNGVVPFLPPIIPKDTATNTTPTQGIMPPITTTPPTIAVVPEPESFVLLDSVLAILAVAGMHYRSRRARRRAGSCLEARRPETVQDQPI
jgi:hypothetical protein